MPIGLLALLLAAVVATVASSDDGDGGGDAYRVRALFGNAFALSPGTEVRAAGARIGTVEELDVDARRRAVVVLRIDDRGFQRFRRDAECRILPQSIIGERYVECTPTQPRDPDSPAPPELRAEEHDGRIQHVLPQDRTVRPIDLDLVANMWEEPQRLRLTVLLNELGAGLAARGEDLDDALRAALPGLRDTNRVLEIIAGQTRELRQMATDGERALRPVADARDDLARFLARVADFQGAVADRNPEVDENLRRLPGTLRELRPSMRRLTELSRETERTMATLRTAAPGATTLLTRLRTFSDASTGPVRRLGAASERGRTALLAVQPSLRRLETLLTDAAPILTMARQLLESLRETGGTRRILDYSFFQGMAINGFDDVGHFLRVGLILTRCSSYATVPIADCVSDLTPGAKAGTQLASTALEGLDGKGTPEQELVARVLDGERAADVKRDVAGDRRYAAPLERARRTRDAMRGQGDLEKLLRSVVGGSR
ncbi:MAG: MlaD family protein [Solirubrobacteraceae bacterium]|nr:MlaD family protein [Solirubrobacteraceae bacterium]